MNYKEQIRHLEDVFFDAKSPGYADINLYSEIFKIFDTPDFKEKQPEIYEAELKRIRDLYNAIIFAHEKGYEQGKKHIE